MKLKPVPVLSGFAMTMLAFALIWQIVIVALLVRATVDLMGTLGRFL